MEKQIPVLDVKKVTLQLHSSNLRDFFFLGKDVNSGDWEGYRFLNDTLWENEISQAEEVSYYWHTCHISAHHLGFISPIVDENIIDLNTQQGRIEARRRINFLRMEIKNKVNRVSRNLLDDGNGNCIGRFRLKNEKVVYVCFLYSDFEGLWDCAGFSFLEERKAPYQFLSDQDMSNQLQLM
jgi:hypothetical protein